MKFANPDIKNVGRRMKKALSPMPAVTVHGQALPASRGEILSYVEHLMKPCQREACDRATD